MRYFYTLAVMAVLICCKTQDFHDVHVNFMERPFAEILNQAQTTQTDILLDFWADG